MVSCKMTVMLVGAKNPIGLMGWRRCDGDGPKPIGHANTSDDDVIVLENLDIKFCEECNAVIITELRKRNESTCLQVVQEKGGLRRS